VKSLRKAAPFGLQLYQEKYILLQLVHKHFQWVYDQVEEYRVEEDKVELTELKKTKLKTDKVEEDRVEVRQS
jgi:hypothetical protein